MVKQVSTDNFNAEVLDSKLPVIVDFWAEWCGPCRALAPVFEKLSEAYKGKLTFVKLNVDENKEVPGKYGVMGIPCMIIFSKGKEIDRIVGNMDEAKLKEKIDSVLKKG